MDLRESIKQMAKTELKLHPRHESYVSIVDEMGKEVPYIALHDVLAELTNYKHIPLEKWQEIVELIKNPPKMRPRSLNEDIMVDAFDTWFEVLEAKVAELKEPSK